MIGRPTLFATCACAALSPAPAFAQDTEEIVITARGATDAPEDAVLSTIIIDRERLRRSASERFDDILADVSGIQQFRRADSRSAHPTSQGLSTRGLGGNAAGRVLIIVDGVPQSDPFGGWPVLPSIIPDRLRQVRVTHGGGDVGWGPGTLSGTIEVESVMPEGEPSLTGSLAVGSRQSIDARASMGHSLGQAALAWSVSHARGEGFIPILRSDRGAADEPADYRQSTAAVRSIVALGGVELDINLSLFDDERSRGVPFSDNGNRGANLSARIAPPEGRWSIVGYRQERRFRSEFSSVARGRGTATLAADQYSVPSSGTGLRAEWRALTAPFDLRLIGDFRRVEGETRERFAFTAGRPTRMRRAGGDAATLGIGAEAERRKGVMTLTLGGRIDHWQIGAGHLRERLIDGATLTDQEFAERSGWQPTARAGVAWRAGPDLGLRAAAYRGWRLPTLNELYRPFRVGADATAANPELKPEVMHGIEAGADLRISPALALSLTAFAARLDEPIVNIDLGEGPGVFPGVGFVPAGGAYRMRRNVDRITSRGVELESRFRRGLWSANLSIAYVDPEISASGDAAALDGKRPAQTALLRGSASLAYRGNGFGWNVSARRASGQFDDDGNAGRLGKSFELDTELEVPINRRLRLALRAENLTNAENITAINSDGSRERTLPRTFWLSIRTR